jgi:serine/threonine protein kinase
MLPQYEILRLVGRGGMGAVYKARHLAEDRFVAIKLLPPEVSGDEGYRKRFEKEVLVLEHLRHPRIVSLLDSGKRDGVCHYFVMEFVDGTSLHDAIQARNLSPARAKEIMCDVCEALIFAHEHGVLHRDLKPGNVLLDQAGRAKLADFGTARWRPEGVVLNGTTGVLFGTRDYMAPELLAEPGSDVRSDIYALGVMVYEAFCFEVPRGNFPPPSKKCGASPALDLIVSIAMESEAAARYASVSDMLEQIKALDVLPQASSSRPSALSICTRRRRPYLWPATVLVALAITAALPFLVRRTGQGPKSTPPLVAVAVAASTPAPVVPPSPSEPSEPVQRAAPPSAPVQAQLIWHDWLSEQVNMPSSISKDERGVRIEGQNTTLKITVSPQLQDQAVRLAYSIVEPGDHTLKVLLRADDALDNFYGFSRRPDCWQVVRCKDKLVRALGSDLKISGLAPGAEEEIEVLVRGEKLEFRRAKEVIFHRGDPFLKEGRLILEFGTGVVLRRIEWADLGQLASEQEPFGERTRGDGNSVSHQ